jgi:small subunit ribosomal protein S8
MSVTDPISDMLTKIRNASLAKFEKVDIPASKLKVEIVKILKNEGYIKTFKKVAQDGRNQIRIYLKYDQANRPVIHGLERMSRPGRRLYTGYQEMPRIFNGYGTLIVTTSQGVITGRKATEQKVGGEILCSVW